MQQNTLVTVRLGKYMEIYTTNLKLREFLLRSHRFRIPVIYSQPVYIFYGKGKVYPGFFNFHGSNLGCLRRIPLGKISKRFQGSVVGEVFSLLATLAWTNKKISPPRGSSARPYDSAMFHAGSMVNFLQFFCKERLKFWGFVDVKSDTIFEFQLYFSKKKKAGNTTPTKKGARL